MVIFLFKYILSIYTIYIIISSCFIFPNPYFFVMLITYYYIFMMHKNDICSNPISLSFRGGSFSFCSICYTVVCVHLTTNNRCGIKEVFFHKAPYQYSSSTVTVLYCSSIAPYFFIFFLFYLLFGRKKSILTTQTI